MMIVGNEDSVLNDRSECRCNAPSYESDDECTHLCETDKFADCRTKRRLRWPSVIHRWNSTNCFFFFSLNPSRDKPCPSFNRLWRVNSINRFKAAFSLSIVSRSVRSLVCVAGNLLLLSASSHSRTTTNVACKSVTFGD